MQNTNALVQTDYVNQLLGIIDSKIQFLSFELREALNSKPSASILGTIPEENARTFDAIERVARYKKLLLTIRNQLNFHNVELVFRLLENNYFAGFTATELSDFLIRNEMGRNYFSASAASDY